MKFQQLPQGARFEYAGQVYTKVGPLTAAADNGQTRMIPRFAVLAPADGAAPLPPAPQGPIPREQVLAALDGYHDACLAWLAQAELTPYQAQSLRDRLHAARQRFLDSLA